MYFGRMECVERNLDLFYWLIKWCTKRREVEKEVLDMTLVALKIIFLLKHKIIKKIVSIIIK